MTTTRKHKRSSPEAVLAEYLASCRRLEELRRESALIRGADPIALGGMFGTRCVAARLGVSQTTVGNWCLERRVPATRAPDGTWRVSADVVARLLAEQPWTRSPRPSQFWKLGAAS